MIFSHSFILVIKRSKHFLCTDLFLFKYTQVAYLIIAYDPFDIHKNSILSSVILRQDKSLDNDCKHIYAKYIESKREKKHFLTYEPSEDSNHRAYSHSLIAGFVVRMNKFCILGYQNFTQ